MPQAQITINAVAGSDDDLPINTLVQLNNNDIGGETTYLWTILDQPEGPVDSLSSTTIQNPTFTPQKEGTYLIQLIVNQAQATEQIDQVIAAVRHLKTRDRIPAAGETTENDTADGWSKPNGVDAILKRVVDVQSDPGLTVVECDATVGTHTVVKYTPSTTIKTGLPGEEDILACTKALATTLADIEQPLGVAIATVDGGAFSGNLAYVRRHGLVKDVTGLAGAVVGDQVFVSDTGVLSLSVGTNRRLVGICVSNETSGFTDVMLDGSMDDLSVAAGTPGIVGVILVTSSSATSHPSITSALAAASSGDVVIVGPGTYAESVTVPAGVSLISVYRYAASITGALATGTRVTLNNNAELRGFNVTLPTNAVGAIKATGATPMVFVHDVQFAGAGASGIGIEMDVAGAVWCVDDLFYTSGTADAIIVQTQGEAHLFKGKVHGSTVVLTTMVRVNGGEMRIVTLCTDGAFSSVTECITVGAGTLVGEDMNLIGATSALRVTNNSAVVCAKNSRLEGLTNDLLIDPGVSTAEVKLNSCEIHSDMISAPGTWFSSAVHIFDFQSAISGDEAQQVWGELHVGHAEHGSESVFGQGDSHVRGLTVITTDNTASPSSDGGNFTDVSAAAASASGSTFAFQGTGANYSILFGTTAANGSGVIKHWGLKMAQTTAAAGGSFIWEVWNGSAWEEFDVCVHDADTPYDQYANDVFRRANSSEQILYGLRSLAPTGPTWTAKTINGVNAYWSRVRISTALTTGPVFEQSKLHPSNFEVNEDGFGEFKGNARPRRDLRLHQRLQYPLSGYVPSAVQVDMAASISLNGTGNAFVNSAQDGLVYVVSLPEGIDTSLPLKFEVGWKPSTTGSGDVEIEKRHAVVNVGDIVDGTIPSTLQADITSINNQLDELILTTFEFSIPTALPGGLLALSVYRDATGGNPDDTYASDIEIVFMRLSCFSWGD